MNGTAAADAVSNSNVLLLAGRIVFGVALVGFAAALIFALRLGGNGGNGSRR